MYKYSKLLWVKILLTFPGILFFALQTLKASASYVSTELLAPDDYSTGFEILINCVALACFVNYLIVCLFRFRDHVSISNGVFECLVHRHTFFLLSRKHVKVNLTDIREFKLKSWGLADFLPYETSLKLHLADGKWRRCILSSVAVKPRELRRLLLENNVSCADDDSAEKSKSKSKWISGVLSVAFTMILLGVSLPLMFYGGDTYMPGNLWIPVGVIGIFFSFTLRDLIFFPSVFCVCIGPLLGAVLFTALVLYNYHGVDKSKAVVMEYRVGNCYSVYHPGSGSGRHRRQSSTSYHLTLCSKETGRVVKRYDISKKMYKKARGAETVKIPIYRGALGYPVGNEDSMEFHNKTKEDRDKIRALRDSNMQERQKILKELRRMRRTSRSTKAKAIGIDSLQRLLDKLRREDRKYHY